MKIIKMISEDRKIQLFNPLIFSVAALLLQSIGTVTGQDLVINEYMTSNALTIQDEDGSTPDWIELYNTGLTTINLAGYTISDSSTIEEPWSFPDMDIHPGNFLMLFASDKNRNELPVQWETVIDWGDIWRYTIPDVNTSSNWYTAAFDDSQWNSGPSGFGYGDGDDNTILSNELSVFLRKEFEVSNPADVTDILFHMDYDDGFVAYINGTEIARANISSTGPPSYNQTASLHEAQMYQGNEPDMFTISNIEGLLTNGTNVLAVQVHNQSGTSSDLTAIPFLTLGRNTSSSGSLSEHLSTGTTNLHTNFKLSSEGDFLIIKNANGSIVDSIYTKYLPTDVSIGRKPDGTGDWMYYDEPTPGASNSTTAYNNISGEVSFALPGGFYTNNLSIELSSDNSNDLIYYTTDGSSPELSGTLYSDPIYVDHVTVIRAQILNPGSIPGKTNSQTYLINENHSLPVISLTTHPENLWDYDSGIYVLGPNAENNNPYFGANFWQDWERPVHIEMYEPDGTLAFAQNAGVRIFGGWTRAFPQKSLAIFARDAYGKGKIKYPIFGESGPDEFSSIVLRNSGNDWNNTMFRDALLTTLFHESVDTQSYRPAVLYLNGEYWGIQNIREKVNEEFLATHHDVDADSVTMLELDGVPLEGNEEEYREMINLLSTIDLSFASNYQYAEDRIDIPNFIQYQIGNIYIDNTDWPGNNIKYWKSSQPGSKWKWIAFDTDFGFGLYGNESNNTLEFAMNPSGPEWPNPPWSTFLFRKLLENKAFENLFINTYCDQLNTLLKPEKVVAKIDTLAAEIEGEIERHMIRWAGNYNSWKVNFARMKQFAEGRPEYARQHLQNVFNLTERASIKLDVNHPAFGRIKINTITPQQYPWTGEYFTDIPVTVEVLPNPGFDFLGWEGDIISESRKLVVNLSEVSTLKAEFAVSNVDFTSIVINEINYNSYETFDTEDWVELYNKGAVAMDISGWILKDDDDTHAFIFPEGTFINSGEYLVVCRDELAFTTLVQGVPTIGDMGFGLSSNGDCVRLYYGEGYLADEVCYMPTDPWPSQANGKGSTIALVEPGIDNSQAENWYALGLHGSPGEENGTLPNKAHMKLNSKLSVYPNPADFKREITITYLLENAEQVNLSVFDISGQHIADLYKGKGIVGINDHTVQLPGDLNPGTYLIHIQGNYVNLTSKILVK